MRLVCAIACAVLAFMPVGAGAETTYQINWCSLNSGGGVMTGGPYTLNSTVGQTVQGFESSSGFLHWIGFWAGEIPTPTLAPSIKAAKLLEDGAWVSVAGKIATSDATDFFTEFFYLQESARSSGIRVAVSPANIAGLTREKSVLNVIGAIGTTADGERQITAPMVIVVSTNNTALGPVAMTNRSVGGSDFATPPVGQYGVTGARGLNNVGLLVRTLGRVVDIGSGYVLIDDGSGVNVRVDTSGLASPPTANAYISVTGISSLYFPNPPGTDRFRLILPRADSDVTGNLE